VSALSRFEELIAGIFEGSLVGLLGAQVQPVEMAKRLARAMETERTIGVGRAIAPNDYTVQLSPDDFQRFQTVQRALERELEEYLREAAREQGLSFLSRPAVRLEASGSVGRHQIRVAARLADRPPPATPEAEIAEHTQRFQAVSAPSPVAKSAAGQTADGAVCRLVASADGSKYPVARSVVTLGRALDNDVVLEDTRVSRYHAEIRLRESRYYVRDLRSTNGTLLNGRPAVEEPLKPGDVISLGGFELLFQAEPAQGSGRGA